MTPDRLMQFAWGFAPALILEAAVRHNVFDGLAHQPLTASELAAQTNTSERGTVALLNALVGMELLSLTPDGRYDLTAESAAFLVSTSAGYQGELLRHLSQLISVWLNLSESVRTGEPALAADSESTGTAFFQDFVKALFAMHYPAARELGVHLGIGGATKEVRVLDLAAGSAVWSIALAQQSAQVKVRAVDWPGVIETTRSVVSQHGLLDRYELVGGDLSQADFGRNQSIALLGHILHGEGRERSRRLLAKTAEAMASGGIIVIAEFLVNADRTGPLLGLLFAVNMLVHTRTGDTYSLEEISTWLDQAGFADVRTLEVPAPSPLILARRL